MNLQLFSLEAGHELGKNVSEKLGVPLSPHEEREFEDGEHKARPLVNVRGNDVFVIESLYGDSGHSVNDKLARLLFFLGALGDASAGRVTAVVPYLAYARKDRKTKPRDPVTTRYLAALFEAVGIDRILVMDVHNPAAYQNAFRCRSDHLEARPIFVRYFASLAEIGKGELVVLSPDAGGVKRAESFRQHLERVLGTGIRNAFMEKQRSGGVVSGETLVGAVEGRTVIVIDDLISTGTTLLRAAQACRKLGARKVFAAATHGIFVGDSNRVLAEPAVDEILVTNTVPPFRLDPKLLEEKVRVLDAAELFAEAITRIHGGGSLVELLEG
ncbi:MAG TPA: ribose-phosphate pyrophosphokinase [Vicinamibacteria bacterium]|nr:ribose-phosphate pyrophosphokinase [Vicinamibacteria bacterium]